MIFVFSFSLVVYLKYLNDESIAALPLVVTYVNYDVKDRFRFLLEMFDEKKLRSRLNRKCLSRINHKQAIPLIDYVLLRSLFYLVILVVHLMF